jgi:hypothetical protein
MGCHTMQGMQEGGIQPLRGCPSTSPVWASISSYHVQHGGKYFTILTQKICQHELEHSKYKLKEHRNKYEHESKKCNT